MNKRCENISKMSNILAKLENILAKAEEVLEEWEAIQPEYDQLVAYYDSEQWRKDYYDSNEGKIPSEVLQGALSEDGIYNAIDTQFQLASDYQTLLESIKAKESES